MARPRRWSAYIAFLVLCLLLLCPTGAAAAHRGRQFGGNAASSQDPPPGPASSPVTVTGGSAAGQASLGATDRPPAWPDPVSPPSPCTWSPPASGSSCCLAGPALFLFTTDCSLKRALQSEAEHFVAPPSGVERPSRVAPPSGVERPPALHAQPQPQLGNAHVTILRRRESTRSMRPASTLISRR
jgi:hypothetical protein